jgi:hypothetical protein
MPVDYQAKAFMIPVTIAPPPWSHPSGIESLESRFKITQLAKAGLFLITATVLPTVRSAVTPHPHKSGLWSFVHSICSNIAGTRSLL